MPAVSELVLNTLVGLVDILLVGQMSMATIAALGYGVAPALAATGLAGEMFWTMSLLFMAIGTGCTALVARSTGAKDPETANMALRQGLLLGLLSAAVMSVVAIGFDESVMQVYRAEALVSELGAQFIRILGYSFLPTAIMMIGMASLRGAGDTRTPLMIMIVVNLVNVAISYVLISGGPGIAPIGVEGAAIGVPLAD
jgi:Na+-driven multidrug efflux pump